MVSITKTSFGRSAAESTGSPRSPQVRARGGSEVEWEWLARLPQLMLSASVVMSVRSLLLFLSLLPRSLSSGKAGLLGCFTQTPQNAHFQNKHSTRRQARSSVCSLYELEQVSDPVWIQFFH